MLEWVPMPSSRGSSQPRSRTCISYVSCIADRCFIAWATREVNLGRDVLCWLELSKSESKGGFLAGGNILSWVLPWENHQGSEDPLSCRAPGLLRLLGAGCWGSLLTSRSGPPQTSWRQLPPFPAIRNRWAMPWLERKCSCSVVSNSLQPYGLYPTRILCPWNFPGKSTGVGCHCLFRRLGRVSVIPCFAFIAVEV